MKLKQKLAEDWVLDNKDEETPFVLDDAYLAGFEKGKQLAYLAYHNGTVARYDPDTIEDDMLNVGESSVQDE